MQNIKVCVTILIAIKQQSADKGDMVKQEKNKSKVFEIILTIILIMPMALLFVLFVILYTPVDFINYRKTQYFKDTKEKYYWYANNSFYVRLYNIIKKANLPVEYYRDNSVKLTGYGYFVYKNILILTYNDINYDNETNECFIMTDGDNYIKIEDSVKSDIENFNGFIKANIADRALVIIENSEMCEDCIPKYENFDLIITNQKITEEMMKNCIANLSINQL